MGFLKKIWQFIIAFICAPTRPVCARAAHHSRPTASTDVRIILCLSPNIPYALRGKYKPEEYVGVISSEYPKKCMIPERAAPFATNSYWDVPVDLPELVSLPGFEQTLFYPFRELADALRYDVLWCTFKEPGSKNYTGHVLFAERVCNGMWIRISEENAEKRFGTIYYGHLYTGGWLYVVPDGKLPFFIAMGIAGRVYVPKHEVIEIA